MRRSTTAVVAVAAVVAAGLAVAAPTIARGIGVFFAVLTSSPADGVQAHVTIYLEPPILIDGGAVIVVGRSMPDDEWRKLASGPNPAADDMANPKRAHVKPGDRLFGAVASSSVTLVEFFYPESGSYTFNFLPAKVHEHDLRSSLRTERLSTGSGNLMTDPQTKEPTEWQSIDTIFVAGKKYEKSWARLASATFTDAFSEHLKITNYEGARVTSLSNDQISKYVVDTHD